MASARRWILFVALLVLGAAVSGLWIAATGGPGSLSGILRIPVFYWIPLLGVTGLHLILRFVRWQFLLRTAGALCPTRRSLVAFLASLVGVATPAYLGEALRCVLIKRNHGIPVRVTLTVLVVERMLDVAALGFVLLAAALAGGAQNAAAIPIGIGAIAVAFLGFGALRILRASTLPVMGELSVPRFGVLAPAFLGSLVLWGIAASAPFVASRALGFSLSPFAGAAVFAQSTLVGGATLMPAGLGSTGTAAVLELESLQFSRADALPLVALFRLTTTGFALAVGAAFFLLELRLRKRDASPGAVRHFDEIALDYERQYAPHIWKLLIDRKVSMISEGLSKRPGEAGIGLDFGCGLGQQAAAMRARGFRVVGLDPSRHLLRKAASEGAPVVAGDGLALPFPDASFDFVYTIGVFHHLPGRDAQDAAAREIARVLKPDGRFLVLETNTRNPLFVFYMGYIFPIVKSIDEGTEQWVPPARWESSSGMELSGIRYFTFVPDTIPKPLLPLFLAIERRLERSVVAPYAVHYMAILTKTGK